MTGAPHIHLRQGPEDATQRWFMDFEDVPETLLHDMIIELLKLVLRYRYRDRDVVIGSNVACRWDPDDRRIGVDPDVILVEPAPPEAETLKSLQVWRPDHHPPKLAIEIVSETNATKDYKEGPVRMSRLGAEELWLFDPERHGPTLEDLGGPFVLQLWRRPEKGGDMERIYAGDAPAFSPVLGAWIVTTNGGTRLRIAEDREGKRLWPTKDEAQAARADAEGARADAEAQAREVAEETAAAEAMRADEEARARRAAEAEVRRLRALLEQTMDEE